jgi:O-antigen ligase
MFLDNPLLGVGKGNYPERYQEYAVRTGITPSRQVYSPHNLYLEVLAENGLLGVLIFGAMVYQMIFRPLYAYADLKKAGLVEQALLFRGITYGILAFLIGSFFLHGAFPRYLWLLFGLAMAADNIARNEIAVIRKGELPFGAGNQ